MSICSANGKPPGPSAHRSAVHRSVAGHDIVHPWKKFQDQCNRWVVGSNPTLRARASAANALLKMPAVCWCFLFDQFFLFTHTLTIMEDVYIGNGKLAGRGVYAARDFEIGEIVKYYNLKPLAQSDFDHLSKDERMFVHSFWGKMYLFPEPSRYTNHSANPNTKSDLQKMCDVAIKFIKKGEMITTNATVEVRKELETFVEAFEDTKRIYDFKWVKGGYRHAVVTYLLPRQKQKILSLQRIDGNWHVLN